MNGVNEMAWEGMAGHDVRLAWPAKRRSWPCRASYLPDGKLRSSLLLKVILQGKVHAPYLYSKGLCSVGPQVVALLP